MATILQGPAHAASASVSAPAPEGRSLPFSHRTALLVLVLFSAALYVGTAFYPSLLDDADSSHALVAREMLQRGDYVTMYMNGIRYLMKAPLHYWLVAFAYRIFGENAFATRLPVALSMIVLVVALYEFGRRSFSARAGFYAALVAATSAGMFMFTRIMIPEAIYALQFTLIFYFFLRAWTGSISPRAGYWSAAALTGLAVLTRGLVGIVFPAAAIFLFITFTRSWKRWRELHLFSCAIIVLVIALPWHILAEMRSPGFLWSFIVNEHINRALGTRWPPDYDAVPLWLWWVEHLAWFFPWCVFLPFAFKRSESSGSGAASSRAVKSANESALAAEGMSPASRQAKLLLYCWAATIFGFFSIIPGSRMEYYAFGAWPAVALLLGVGIARAEQYRSAWLTRAHALLAVLGTAVAAMLAVLVAKSYAVSRPGDIATLLASHPDDFYRVSMAHIFDLTPQAFAALRVPALLAAAGFGIAFTLAWFLRRRSRQLASAITIAMGMGVFFIAANLAYGAFNPLLSSRTLAEQINAQLRPQDHVVIYWDFDELSSIAFYTHRRVFIYARDARAYNNLAFGAKFPDAPHVFLNDEQFAALWKQPERVFVAITQEKRLEALDLIVQQGAWIFAESGGKLVLTNHQITPDEKRWIVKY